jgi:hypothetical protein
MNASVDLTRRRLLIGSMAVTLGLAVTPATLWAKALNEPASHPALPLLELFCDLVLPKTDTPGAKELGVAKFVLSSTKHGLRNSSDDTLAVFEKALDQHAKTSFKALSKDKQLELMTALDQKVFSRAPSDLPKELYGWRQVKQLIIIGFYTSEVGATQELRYNLVPGTLKQNVPLKQDSRAWSSDWTGVRFG